MQSLRRSGWIAGLSVLLVVSAACGAARGVIGRGPAAEPRSAVVETITAVSSVEASGAVAARQSASLFWQTTGIVAEVIVGVGDRVTAGQVLMTLDPTSAPQNVILAQADLIAAQRALDDLRHPSALSLANARKAVADAEKALERAQRSLRNLNQPDVDYYRQQVERAADALRSAQNDAAVTDLALSLRAAQDAADAAQNRLSDIQSLEARYPGCCTSRLEGAQQAYDRAAEDLQNATLRLQQSEIQTANAVEDAQENLDQAERNLAAILRSPDQIDLALAQADVVVAEAALADAQARLDELIHGPDPDDLASASARVQAAQAAVGALTLSAPFAGEVLVINYQPGDAVASGQVAVILADRSQLHVDVSVDESDVSTLRVADPVSVTLDAVSGLALSGQVAQIEPVGESVQGLVRYTVQVVLAQTDPRVLLGMTANVNIVTDVEEGTLAVPLDAVQLDEQGEFVNRLRADGTRERVDIVSGQTQGDLVVVRGGLQPGDRVELVTPQPTNNGSPFGPG